MQDDPACDNRTESEQGGQVEDVGTDDDARAHRTLLVRERRDGGGDVGLIGRQGGEQAEERLGQPQPFTQSLHPGDEDPAGSETDRGPTHEGDQREPYSHGNS